MAGFSASFNVLMEGGQNDALSTDRTLRYLEFVGNGGLNNENRYADYSITSEAARCYFEITNDRSRQIRGHVPDILKFGSRLTVRILTYQQVGSWRFEPDAN